jgi:hypothetical protein
MNDVGQMERTKIVLIGYVCIASGPLNVAHAHRLHIAAAPRLPDHAMHAQPEAGLTHLGGMSLVT